MKFYAVWQSYSMRYYSWLNAVMIIILFMIIRPISAGKGFMFVEMFNGMFLRDIRLTGIFLAIIVLFQIVGWDITNKHIKILEILEDKIVFSLFNGKVFKFNYSDIKSISLVNDVWLGLIFEIILVSEERVKIRERLKNKHQALELIQKKLTNK
jgi:hypothetical protein